jgi:two-component system, chemotaxis family, CheB/CheR fusion protein
MSEQTPQADAGPDVAPDAGPDAEPAQSGSPQSNRSEAPDPEPSMADTAVLARVIGIGASSGGLEACKRLFADIDIPTAHAFILVQHLDPHHDSMMAELLGARTGLAVSEAINGGIIEPGHLYTIPPGSYLAVKGEQLLVSLPDARHGARLPFDYLLTSLAAEFGSRAVAVVLTGNGADGSIGIQAIRKQGGLVIAQNPEEAEFDGMPRSAIETGCVEEILPLALISSCLNDLTGRPAPDSGNPDGHGSPDWLKTIIALLFEQTGHDFTLYKSGTLKRRILSRQTLIMPPLPAIADYIQLLKTDKSAVRDLARDLLINVTSFFRDPPVFKILQDRIIPELVDRHPPGRSLRIWIAGCSTGEETYSLVMLFHEHLAASGRDIRLQVFASDVDADAIAEARAGLYTAEKVRPVSPDRLAKFFTAEVGQFRVLQEIRNCIVFSVQDVLADPPFSQLDLVSCRNLLIYLQPEAQQKVLSLFHFALRENGILILGSAETVGSLSDCFASLAKAERIYRHERRSRPGEVGFPISSIGTIQKMVSGPSGLNTGPSRQAALADLCRSMVLTHHAPAAVLISRSNECLYSLGPTDRYLHVAPGHPTRDLFAMVRPGMILKLKGAVQQVIDGGLRVSVPLGRMQSGGELVSTTAVVHPVSSHGESMLLVCFVESKAIRAAVAAESSEDEAASESGRNGALEQELLLTRTELETAIRSLEQAAEEQKAINEEATSVNEEFQSTNEELLTSKEELQSLNEELTALNAQLHDTLEREQRTADDLQNVLYSTDIATIFLDSELRIRFFTPATRQLFNVMPGDIGRPLADLRSNANDPTLLPSIHAVIGGAATQEEEVSVTDGIWFLRRIQRYRTQQGTVEGVVITYADISERRQAAEARDLAKRQAELASMVKSRFLAAASHDLRQPLQTMALLQALLDKTVIDSKPRALISRLHECISAMSGMLNDLLDINQIEAGTVRVDRGPLAIGPMLQRLKDEFSYHAQSHGLEFRYVTSSAVVISDQRLLEQILRNLLVNALKYTRKGRVLLGCRRHGQQLSIEIWDTGIGIPKEEQEAIFEEFHQLGNPARDRSLGLGLGLSIVRRLTDLVGHKVWMRSVPGKGSVFAITLDLATGKDQAAAAPFANLRSTRDGEDTHTAGSGADTDAAALILIVEDEVPIRDLLTALISRAGYRTVVALNGVEALAMVEKDGLCPDLLLVDFNLPAGINGLDLAKRVRRFLGRHVPAIILTGDISTVTLRRIASQNDIHMHKPANITDLLATISRTLNAQPQGQAGQVLKDDPSNHALAASETFPEQIWIVEDNGSSREALAILIRSWGVVVRDFATAEAFLAEFKPGSGAGLLVDAYLPGMGGIPLIQQLATGRTLPPTIVMTGHSDVAIAVSAMKAGAVDFIEKPFGVETLRSALENLAHRMRVVGQGKVLRDAAAQRIAPLTARQHQVMDMILAGHPNKNIAADLGLSQRTVENHRAAIMQRTGTKSLPELARIAQTANWQDPDEPGAEAP